MAGGSVNHIMKKSLHLLLWAQCLLFVPAFAFTPTPIPCPSLQFIQAHISNVNAVQIVIKHEYAVYTSIPFYDSTSKLTWSIGADVNTIDFNTAYDIGFHRIQNTVKQTNIYAEYLHDFWLCLYSDNNNAPVYLTSAINSDVDIHKELNRKL